MPLDDVFEFFRHYDRETYEVFACQGNEPTDDDIVDFEREVGYRLPDDFREFTKSSLGGLYMAVREELWPRPKPYAVGPFWSFLYGLNVFGIATDIPDWLDIRVRWRQFRDQAWADLIPFLQRIGDADAYCFNTDGQIVEWSHDEPDERRVVDMTFPDLLLQEIHELDERKNRKIQGEG